ncbi:hypothetical protein [Furfurilactobacillus siliginis]|uniref:Uncharacterized protein n=1 Tax=Furfurilactobacillus siliginis TaxID=348151 RepID=A0A0R2L4M4_9LACO|nr:hypothetical protein [Furfurilactobacillus siliginis]KRN96719.1 hypothetical protein IV55_GL001253 [Furfurilactobacillus siliginis]GEK28868.1 hypothetical protein LSI01_11790 [Furfurilactobacillus siliginis]
MAKIAKAEQGNVVSGDFGNSNGGGTMDNRHVTHEELDHAIDKVSDKIDLLSAHIDTKFEKQKNWFYGTGISIVVAVIAVLTYILK